MVALSSKFHGQIWLVFVLTLENGFSQRFHFKGNRKNIGSSKNGTRDFQNNPPFERSARFYVTISGKYERFQYFNFEKDFLENGNLFEKTEVPCFQFKTLRQKMHHFYTKLPNRQIEW